MSLFQSLQHAEPNVELRELRKFVILAGACLSLMVIGCGPTEKPEPPKSKVTGTVKFKGQPVKEGSVVFENKELGYVASGTIKDGAFTVPVIPIAKYKVFISPPQAPPSSDPGKPNPPPDPADIPKNYREYATSDLSADIKAGDNTVTLELQ